jgi:hypothetical protein
MQHHSLLSRFITQNLRLVDDNLLAFVLCKCRAGGATADGHSEESAEAVDQP